MKLLADNAGYSPAPSLLVPDRRQAALVTLVVLLAHAGLLGWLQTSPATVQLPQPAVVTMALLASPEPVQASRQAAAPRQLPKPAPRAESQKAPAAVAQADPSPLPTTPGMTSVASASSTTAAPAAAASSQNHAAQTPMPAKVELPSASADYLNNPKPVYPPLSRRLREEGKVVLRVLIETDGSASRAEIRSSSGYERLDQAALQTVLKWRYLPAMRNGVPEAMWFNIPVNFVLE